MKIFLATLVAIGQLACAAPATELDVEVRPVFHGEPLLLDSLRYKNPAGEVLSVTRLSYLLTGLALQREDESWLEFPGPLAWMDAAQQRTSVGLSSVPPGRYRAIRFFVGPDASANGSDPAQWPAGHPLNGNLNNLHWDWQSGYIFLALEGRWQAGANDGGFVWHLARDPNRTCVTLTVDLDARHDAVALVDFDLARLMTASFARDGQATHSRVGDPVSGGLAANLAGAFRVAQVAARAPAISLPSPVRPLFLPETFTAYPLVIGKGAPIPDLPRDNPLLEERVALGRALFKDKSFSRDGTISCASCHQENAGYGDPRRFSVGVRGQVGTRRAMPLTNLAWKTSFFWDGRAPSLRAAVFLPVADHTEMDETAGHAAEKLAADPAYTPMFRAAFGSSEITPEKIGLALENYLLTLTSFDAKFDQMLRGQATFTRDEQRGFELFMTEYDPRTGQRGADCFHCHGGPLFSDHAFHNNGLAPNAGDPGRFRFTAQEADRDKFATPSLRNVSRRAPYMQDGRFASLGEVIAHYDHGVTRSPTLDPNLAKHPNAGLGLSAADQQAIVAFLKTL